eukprot:COSAG06_NODE_37699_length_432_cov_0.747748_1_plen_69_part_10
MLCRGARIFDCKTLLQQIGLATATSPEGPWLAYKGNPILSSARTKCPNPTSDDPLPFDVYRCLLFETLI